mmetsp:Transcript_14669/g.25978  ORF Transcript_14669/g.25978 Transcript_14669/m.25978 type:complete len:723 (-) Transcript_14669:109-2277(-)
MMRVSIVLFALLLPASAVTSGSRAEASLAVSANPIRKVVTMLQNIQKKVAAEGEKEKDLYDKFMCYCKTGVSDLKASIAAANTKIPEAASDIEEKESSKAGLEVSLKEHQVDRESAKKAIAEATSIREKEAAEFAKEKSEADANIAAMTKAIAALEKGMTGFLQTAAAATLKNVVLNSNTLDDYDREQLTSFLSGSQDEEYAPQSGEIVGILKQMAETMSKGAVEATATEEEAIKSFNALVKAKEAEIASLTQAIETATLRIGELGVEVIEMKNDLTDTEAALADDTKFLADLEKNCGTKTAEFEANQKVRAEELLALSETIKVLNDDDALELFKKTLPSASSSFMQVTVTVREQRAEALAALSHARHSRRPELDFIALAIRGKKVSFDKVLKMIDEMVALLEKEQQDDSHKKETCIMQLEAGEDKKKGLVRAVSDLDTMIEDAKEGIAALTAEITALEEGIAALDKSVAEATEQRKEEHKEFTALMASDSAAVELLGFAKNRLNKFYNPSLYKADTTTLSYEDKLYAQGGGVITTTQPGGIANTGITVDSFVQISMHKAAPPPPPETMGAYSKKSGASSGVIALIDTMVKDLEKEMQTAKLEEDEAQSDYEDMTADSAAKRAKDSKMLTDKGSAKARMEDELNSHTIDKKETVKELMATEEYIAGLHGECDWLIQNYDVRKEARTGEIESLKKAKDVLSGADYSLLQSTVKHSIRRVHAIL